MILKEEIIQAILNPNDNALRMDLCKEFNITEIQLKRILKCNEKNNKLTTYASLQIIKEHTGITESEIVTAETVNA